MENYVDFAVQKAVELLAIDSPTGYTAEAEEFVLREFRALGFAAERTAKGGILIDLGGENADDALLLEAHADTLGGMVAEIKGDGRLRIVNVGGMNANNAEAENCRVVTKFSGSYEGTLQLINASVHVNGDYASTKRSWDTVEVVLDEAVESADDVKALGISVGDFVCFEPRTRVTKSGYIKSRFLDDKLSAGILLGFAKYLHDEGKTPARRVYAHVTVYEEVGHGGSASVPAGVTEATTTEENLRCSLDLIEAETGTRPAQIAVISGEYHLLRAELLARRAGAEALGVPSYTHDRAFYCLMLAREVCGVWAALLF